jgi:hypothetical protein
MPRGASFYFRSISSVTSIRLLSFLFFERDLTCACYGFVFKNVISTLFCKGALKVRWEKFEIILTVINKNDLKNAPHSHLVTINFRLHHLRVENK